MSLPLVPFSQAWADAFREAINADVTYRRSATRWQSPLAFVLDDGAPVGLIGPVALELTLDRGLCNMARIISPDACTAPYVLRADYATWRRIIQGDLDPMQAVVRGEVRLSGNLMALMLHAQAVTSLVACARQVPTQYPDDPRA